MSAFQQIPEDFFDKEYRHAYAEDFLNTKIAMQLRVLREQHGLTQEELAKRIGTKQSGIARLENVNYSAWKIETLKKIARAFDVVFMCGFISFSSLLEEAEKFGRKALQKLSFDEEIAEQEQETATLPAAIPNSTTLAENLLRDAPVYTGKCAEAQNYSSPVSPEVEEWDKLQEALLYRLNKNPSGGTKINLEKSDMHYDAPAKKYANVQNPISTGIIRPSIYTPLLIG